ncbi:MAG: tyrosine-type recombinase/integrase [Oscillospiraceae bacterium]|nr:tyrosine-type recombinase/integrase [Oscillospiraceae bacterium]
MNTKIITEIIEKLKADFDDNQLQTIERTLYRILKDKDVIDVVRTQPQTNEEALAFFLAAKKIEGCSNRSISFYQTTLQKMFVNVTKFYYSVTTEDIRLYLSQYQENNNVSKSTIDNMRRIISSFFTWLENEDYIVKSPARRIRKVKTPKLVKETFSEESIELIRQNCKNLRDLAIIDLLYSTGIRVGELVRLDIADIDFSNKECIVLGKGNKQRKVYFDAKTKIHLQQYIASRKDNNTALFVSLLSPYNRLKVSGVEIALRKIGERLEIGNVHPHKFRRTLATKAIDKGMPIEQVQHLLGHAKIDTTLEYAMVDDENVKISHKKYLG